MNHFFQPPAKQSHPKLHAEQLSVGNRGIARTNKMQRIANERAEIENLFMAISLKETRKEINRNASPSNLRKQFNQL